MYVLGRRLDTGALCLLTGYGENAVKHMRVMQMGQCYRFMAEKRTSGKPICLAGTSDYHMLAEGSKITPLSVEEVEFDKLHERYPSLQEDDYTEMMESDFHESGTLLCPLSSLSEATRGTPPTVRGVVYRVQDVTFNSGPAKKVHILDDTGVSILTFFENRNIPVGSTLTLVGAQVYEHPRDGHKELSIVSSTLVATGAFEAPTAWKKRVAQADLQGLVNTAMPQAGEIRAWRDVVEEAVSTKSTVTATVQLSLDPDRPTVSSTLTYNACTLCMRKVCLIAETEEGDLMGHEADSTHQRYDYQQRYLFTARFLQLGENKSDARTYQDDNHMGERIFGLTAEELGDMDEEARDAVIQHGANALYTYNIRVLASGELVSMVMAA